MSITSIADVDEYVKNYKADRVVFTPDKNRLSKIVSMDQVPAIKKKLTQRSNPMTNFFDETINTKLNLDGLNISNIRYVLTCGDQHFIPYDESLLFMLPLHHLGVPEDIRQKVFREVALEVVKVSPPREKKNYIAKYAGVLYDAFGVPIPSSLLNKPVSKLEEVMKSDFGENWMSTAINKKIIEEEKMLLETCLKEAIFVKGTKENIEKHETLTKELIEEQQSKGSNHG